jgi:hypothetical protein
MRIKKSKTNKCQFKKKTGLTPSYYKSLKEHKHTNIEEL